MLSETKGAVKEVLKEASNADHVPCHNRMLNLSISQSSTVTPIRNAVGTMQEVIFFFNNKRSSKRQYVLKKELGHKLSGLCETRWIERHHGVSQFRRALKKITRALESVMKWKYAESSKKATNYRLNLLDTTTIVSIVCLSDVLSTTLGLSTFFQRPKIDLKSAKEEFDICLKMLERKKEKSDVTSQSICHEVLDLAEELETSIKMPRTTKKQKHRNNCPVKDPETFFRRTIYIPLLDNVITDLKFRFPDKVFQLYNFSFLFPAAESELNQNEVDEAVSEITQKYYKLLDEKIKAANP